MPAVFAVPVFFIVFRETLETSIIVSVLLSFLKQQYAEDQDKGSVYKRLVKQVGFLDQWPPSANQSKDEY